MPTSPNETPLSLLERLRRPDRGGQAWDEFVARYAKLLKSWCRSWGIQPADADDVVQETLLSVFASLPSFERQGIGSFRKWMKTIARRCWLHIMKRLESARAGETLAPEYASGIACEELVSSFSSEARRELLELSLALVQKRVKETTWQAFSLTALQEISGVEAARQLGIPIGSVYMARCRVQRLIAEELLRLDPDR